LTADFEQLLRAYRRKPLSAFATDIDRCNYDREAIERIIPHRSPFLFLDAVTGVDLAAETIIGRRTLSADDPVFAGHFPGVPLYPAVLQLETVGQLGLCLHYFLTNKTTKVPAAAVHEPIRVTRVLGAHFIEPILPGSELTLLSKRLSEDAFFETYIGQVMVGSTVCSVSIGEICLG
jgi:3-hydroxyacyl-[acyl-carrier-protein] dehydratase